VSSTFDHADRESANSPGIGGAHKNKPCSIPTWLENASSRQAVRNYQHSAVARRSVRQSLRARQTVTDASSRHRSSDQHRYVYSQHVNGASTPKVVTVADHVAAAYICLPVIDVLTCKATSICYLSLCTLLRNALYQSARRMLYSHPCLSLYVTTVSAVE